MSGEDEKRRGLNELREEVLHWLDHRLDRFDDVSDADLESIVAQLEDLSLDEVKQKLRVLGFDESTEFKADTSGESATQLFPWLYSDAYLESIDVLDKAESFVLVYSELHKLAEQQIARWGAEHSLDATALVHDAYLRLVDRDKVLWQNRALFLSVAARAMRHILIDRARRVHALKRGGDRQTVSLDETQSLLEGHIPQSEEQAETLVSLDEALQRLEQLNSRQSRIVECRFFGGMTIEETAEALYISRRTVERDWAKAKAWLYREIVRSSEK